MPIICIESPLKNKHSSPCYVSLVGGLEHFLFSHILGISSSQLTFIFFRGVAQPPTSSAFSCRKLLAAWEASFSQNHPPRFQPNIADNILREAPFLAESLLDGLIWRSHKSQEQLGKAPVHTGWCFWLAGFASRHRGFNHGLTNTKHGFHQWQCGCLGLGKLINAGSGSARCRRDLGDWSNFYVYQSGNLTSIWDFTWDWSNFSRLKWPLDHYIAIQSVGMMVCRKIVGGFHQQRIGGDHSCG